MIPSQYIGRMIMLVLLFLASFLLVLGYNQDGNQTQPKERTEIMKLLNELCLDIYSKSAQAIVTVKSPVTLRNSSTGAGTGVVINEKGYVLTAFENIEDAQSVVVTGFGIKTSKMEVAKVNEVQGWALLSR
ncbi:MAG: S1C family serine protease [Planctomycetes bacterium]|nr:S1C family serine protease [Planctomycetota bacterium]